MTDDEPLDPELRPDPLGVPPREIIKWQKRWALLFAIAAWAGVFFILLGEPEPLLTGWWNALVAAAWWVACSLLSIRFYPYTLDQIMDIPDE